MNKQEIINKIMQKKEFSKLPEKEVEMAFSQFDNSKYSDEEKIKRSREILGKVFWGFRSTKLLSPKNKNENWILRKHFSTRERLPYYQKIYKRVFSGIENSSVIDLGCGINGFSYTYFPIKVNYVGIEGVGQLVELTNSYFKNKKINGKIYHLSLFELDEIKKIIKKAKQPRVVFLLKVIDGLEVLKRNYSKKLLIGISSLAKRIAISFSTESIIKRKKFKVKRVWIINFIKENFKIFDDFEVGGERYIIFEK